MHTNKISWSRLVPGIVLTSILSLSVHVVMLEKLGAPYPGDPIHAPLAQFFSRGVLAILGLIYLCQLSSPFLSQRSFFVQSISIFILSTTLTESLIRFPFMEGWCSNSILYAYLSNIPKLLTALVIAILVVLVTPRVPKFWQKAIAAVFLAALSMYVLAPMFDGFAKAPLASLAYLSHDNWCELPYGWNIDGPAYISFLEPTIAAFAVAALVWERLSTKPLMRLVQFTVLVLLMKRQVLAAFIYMHYSSLPPLPGLAAMGQFMLEALALAILTGVTWDWARKVR